MNPSNPVPTSYNPLFFAQPQQKTIPKMVQNTASSAPQVQPVAGGMNHPSPFPPQVPPVAGGMSPHPSPVPPQMLQPVAGGISPPSPFPPQAPPVAGGMSLPALPTSQRPDTTQLAEWLRIGMKFYELGYWKEASVFLDAYRKHATPAEIANLRLDETVSEQQRMRLLVAAIKISFLMQRQHGASQYMRQLKALGQKHKPQDIPVAYLQSLFANPLARVQAQALNITPNDIMDWFVFGFGLLELGYWNEGTLFLKYAIAYQTYLPPDKQQQLAVFLKEMANNQFDTDKKYIRLLKSTILIALEMNRSDAAREFIAKMKQVGVKYPNQAGLHQTIRSFQALIPPPQNNPPSSPTLVPPMITPGTPSPVVAPSPVPSPASSPIPIVPDISTTFPTATPTPTASQVARI